MGYSDLSGVIESSLGLGAVMYDVGVLLGVVGFFVDVEVIINVVGVDVSFNFGIAEGDISGVGGDGEPFLKMSTIINNMKATIKNRMGIGKFFLGSNSYLQCGQNFA
jgi:hypothetical protein